MTSSARRRLEALKKTEIERTLAAALDDPEAPLGPQLARIEALEKLLARAPRGRLRALAWPLAVAVVSTSLLALGVTIRVPQSRLVLSVSASSATFLVSEPWRWLGETPMRADYLRAEELSEVDTPPLPVAASLPEATNSFEMSGAGLSLVSLNVAEDTRVTVETAGAGQLDLYAMGGGGIGGEVAAVGPLQAVFDGGGARAALDLDLAIPETIGFRGDGHSIVPVWLRLAPLDQVAFADLRVRELSFAQARAFEPGSVQFVSAIRSGTLTLTDTGTEVDIGEDALALREVEGRITRLVAGEDIRIDFEGIAGGIRLGPGDFARNLMPTVAEYLYHNQRLAFFWTALVFLWGLFWSGRRLIAV